MNKLIVALVLGLMVLSAEAKKHAHKEEATEPEAKDAEAAEEGAAAEGEPSAEPSIPHKKGPKCKQPKDPKDWMCKWEPFHFEEYSAGAHGWSNNAVSECNCRTILGGYQRFAGGEIFKVFEDLPEHTHVRLTGHWYFLDDWRKETAFAKVDDKHVWTKPSHGKQGEHGGVNICGDPSHHDFINVPMDIVHPHTDDCMKINLGTNQAKDASVESWGISDLAIFTCVHKGLPENCCLANDEEWAEDEEVVYVRKKVPAHDLEDEEE